METITIQAGDEAAFRRLRDLLNSPEPILLMVGAYVVERAQEAFTEQKWNGEEWPERYHWQDDPFINVAGLVADLASGADKPKARRFDRKPALFDTGALFNTLSPEQSMTTPDKYTVEVGSSRDYASTQLFGGISAIPVTSDMRAKLAAWLESPEGEPFYLRLLYMTQDQYTEHETQVIPRQFLGISDDMEKDITTIVEQGFAFEVMHGAS